MEEFVPLDPMGMFSAQPAQPQPAPATAQEPPPADASAPGLGAERSAAPSAPGLEASARSPQPPPEQGASTIPANYLASVKAAESSGNPLARNPASSATGLYQFTTGTWRDLMRTRPELGLTPDGRTDPAQQERAMLAFTEGNAQVLRRNNIPVDSGTLYAAHFLGAGGAVKALSADPSMRMADVADPDAVAANPFLQRMSVGDFRAWASRKATGAPASKGSATDVPVAAAAPRSPAPAPAQPAMQEVTPTQTAGAELVQMARPRRQQAPGLPSSPRPQGGRNPNAIGLDGAMDSEVAELDAQIAAIQQAAYRDPRAAAQLAQLQQQRSNLAAIG